MKTCYICNVENPAGSDALLPPSMHFEPPRTKPNQIVRALPGSHPSNPDEEPLQMPACFFERDDD